MTPEQFYTLYHQPELKRIDDERGVRYIIAVYKKDDLKRTDGLFIEQIFNHDAEKNKSEHIATEIMHMTKTLLFKVSRELEKP